MMTVPSTRKEGQKERKKAIEGVPRARGNVGLDQNAGANIKHV